MVTDAPSKTDVGFRASELDAFADELARRFDRWAIRKLRAKYPGAVVAPVHDEAALPTILAI